MKTLGRPRAFDREQALQNAMRVFWRKGFAGASMNDLCEGMGIRSPSLYAAFGSKEGLYAEAVQRYNAAAYELIWGQVDTAPSVREGIAKVLLAAADVVSGTHDNPSGCLVTFATVEDAPSDSTDFAKTARIDSLAKLKASLCQAVSSGELPQGTDVERLARFYLGVVQSMAIQARDGAKLADLKGMAKIAMTAWPSS